MLCLKPCHLHLLPLVGFYSFVVIVIISFSRSRSLSLSLSPFFTHQVLTRKDHGKLVRDLDSAEVHGALVSATPQLAKLLGTSINPAQHTIGFIEVLYALTDFKPALTVEQLTPHVLAMVDGGDPDQVALMEKKCE